MKRKIMLIFILAFIHNLYADEDLLNDYKLLYIDLINIKTWGYKSFYNSRINRSTENVTIDQGALQTTGYHLDCAIMGEGFFKIRLEDGLIGYTRSGNFRITIEGEIVTPQGYQLFEPISLERDLFFKQDFIKITQDHNVFLKSEIGEEIKIAQLLTYKISSELLEHYRDAIYVIKNGLEYEEEITFNNKIIQGTLEMSNFPLEPIILRMYYILSILDDTSIANIEYKRELLRFQIEKMSRENRFLEFNMFALYNKITEILGGPNYRERSTLENYNDVTNYINSHLYYLESILPFLKYDY